jgi:hypothetical protein
MALRPIWEVYNFPPMLPLRMDPVYICDMARLAKATVKSEPHLQTCRLNQHGSKKKSLPGSAMKASDCLAISAFL